MIIAIWIVALLLLALWTTAAWGLASVIHLVQVDGAWVSQVKPWLQRVPFAGWLEGWMPTWLDTAHALLQAVQAALTWVGGTAPVLVWGLWALGSLGLLLLAGVLTGLVALVRRSMPPPAPPLPPAAAA